MAAIALRACLFLLVANAIAVADQPHDVLSVINQVATALTDGDPSDAMTPFDRSCTSYGALENDFAALTAAFLITNEADITSEDDSAQETKLTLQWALTLTGKTTNESNRRTAEIHVRLLLKKGKWKIVELSPIDIFTP